MWNENAHWPTSTLNFWDYLHVILCKGPHHRPPCSSSYASRGGGETRASQPDGGTSTRWRSKHPGSHSSNHQFRPRLPTRGACPRAWRHDQAGVSTVNSFITNNKVRNLKEAHQGRAQVLGDMTRLVYQQCPDAELSFIATPRNIKWFGWANSVQNGLIYDEWQAKAQNT